jgi:hypothetical protein
MSPRPDPLIKPPGKVWLVRPRLSREEVAEVSKRAKLANEYPSEWVARVIRERLAQTEPERPE